VAKTLPNPVVIDTFLGGPLREFPCDHLAPSTASQQTLRTLLTLPRVWNEPSTSSFRESWTSETKGQLQITAFDVHLRVGPGDIYMYFFALSSTSSI